VTTEALVAELEHLRAAAAHRLRLTASEFGGSAQLTHHSELAWAEAHRCAVVSVLHDDYGNAVVILRDAVHTLERAAEAVRRGELSQSDIGTLVRTTR
jgi:hypothetical protein